MKKKKLLMPFAALCFTLFSCERKNEEANDDNKKFCMTDSLLQAVTFDTVKSESVINELILSGKITADEEKQVKVFPLAGGHVAEVKASLGDYVEAGQVLVVIHSADLAGYQSEFTAAQSDLAIAKKNLDVAEDMYKNGLSSEVEHITAQKEYQKALSQFNKVSEVLRIYGSSGKDGDAGGNSGYLIKAPISGFIVEKNVNTGQEVRPDDATNLFTISDLKDVWAVANVYESDIAKVQLNYDADVTTMSYGDKNFSGKVNKISSILNPDTKVLNVKIKLQNPDNLLKPGLFARITIRYPEDKKMLSIPPSSVIFDDNKNYVVKYKGKCDVAMQQVTVLKSSNNRSYIQNENIALNDVVVSKGGLFVFTALKKR
ncbi:MAG TPA: efflux RND transporter periplasmic adaptor subunit [Bacteroidia bacterium]